MSSSKLDPSNMFAIMDQTLLSLKRSAEILGNVSKAMKESAERMNETTKKIIAINERAKEVLSRQKEFFETLSNVNDKLGQSRDSISKCADNLKEVQKAVRPSPVPAPLENPRRRIVQMPKINWESKKPAGGDKN